MVFSLELLSLLAHSLSFRHNTALGFCYFNNIAVAAKHAIHTKQAERVLILDIDIHHGNGIQDVTYDDPNIFYLSIHRASFGKTATEKDWFYPGTGRHTETGKGAGAGTNLNIVWGKGGMGNTEYAAAFTEVVLPVLSAFDPDLLMIACGLDAAKGDLLGDCGLSPDMYYIMTKSLLETAGKYTPVVVALEGGYDLDTIAICMEAMALALLDEPWKENSRNDDRRCSSDTSCGCEFTLSRYWKHEDFDQSSNVSISTMRAVAAIKRSAKALANKGTCLGNIDFIPNPRLSAESGGTTPLSDYRFCAANRDIATVIPRNNRPCQSNDRRPFKKRRLFIEMEAASRLLALTENCC